MVPGARSSTKVIVLDCVGLELRCRAHDVMFKFAVRLVVDPVDVGHSTSYRSGGWWVLYGYSHIKLLASR